MYKFALGIDLDWPFEHHYDVVRGCLEYCDQNGIECLIEPWLENAESIDSISGGYDGIVARATPVLANYCKDNEIPLVNVWRNSDATSYTPTVTQDCASIMKNMVSYFRNRGFHQIVFFKKSNDANYTDLSQQFKKELIHNNMNFDDDSIINTNYPVIQQDWDEFNKIVSLWAQKQSFPVAVCTSDHLTARYLIEWCKKNGILIPVDIAVLSAFSDDLICNTLEPTISHIKSQFTQIGYEAAAQLHKLVKGENVSLFNMVRAGSVIEKKSTDVTYLKDPTVSKALRFIKDNTSSQIQVPDVAESVNISRRSLERRFKKSLNTTVNKEIINSKIECAKKLIMDFDKTISEVAKLTGISSGQRLSQLFKHELGISISEFRKKCK